MDKNITGTGFYLSQGGEEFILLENGNPLVDVKVPKENETSETVTFNDKSGNKYQLKIKTTLTEISYEIELQNMVDEEGFNFFKDNVGFAVDDRELNYDPWEFYSPEDIEQGHEKRLRWAQSSIEKELYEVSIILNVSSLETLMKDTFNRGYVPLYYHHILDEKLNNSIMTFIRTYRLRKGFIKGLLSINKNNINQKIVSYIQKIKYINFDEFCLKYLLKNVNYSRDEKIGIFINLIRSSKDISFQKLKGAKSFPWIFRNVFNIDISKFIQNDKINGIPLQDYIVEMFELRHKLIHGVELNIKIEKEESLVFQEVTKKLCEFIIDESVKLSRSLVKITF
jgi:hypothetical protein